jgi:hypothetical protein
VCCTFWKCEPEKEAGVPGWKGLPRRSWEGSRGVNCISKAVAGEVTSGALGGMLCWMGWVFIVGMFPRRGWRSAKPNMLEAKAPWEKPVSLFEGFETWPKCRWALEPCWTAEISCIPRRCGGTTLSHAMFERAAVLIRVERAS